MEFKHEQSISNLNASSSNPICLFSRWKLLILIYRLLLCFSHYSLALPPFVDITTKTGRVNNRNRVCSFIKHSYSISMALIYNQTEQFPLIICLCTLACWAMKNLCSYRFHLSKCEAFMKWKFLAVRIIIVVDGDVWRAHCTSFNSVKALFPFQNGFVQLKFFNSDRRPINGISLKNDFSIKMFIEWFMVSIKVLIVTWQIVVKLPPAFGRQNSSTRDLRRFIAVRCLLKIHHVISDRRTFDCITTNYFHL